MCSAGMTNTDSKIEAVAATNSFMNNSNTEEELMNILLNESDEHPVVI
jgi:hypothetical protein